MTLIKFKPLECTMELSMNTASIFNFLVSLGINALLITYVFPKLSGFTFTGKFWPNGVVYALVIEIAAVVISLLVSLVVLFTLGLAAIPLAFFMIFGFWLINAIYLKVVAHYMPEHLTIKGWTPAIIAGLIMMVVGMILGDGSMISVTMNGQPMP